MHWLLLHEMLMCAAESKTTWSEAAETRPLFQDRWVALPPTAWQANTNFLLWLCAWLAATLQFNSMATNKWSNYSRHFWRKKLVLITLSYLFVLLLSLVVSSWLRILCAYILSLKCVPSPQYGSSAWKVYSICVLNINLVVLIFHFSCDLLPAQEPALLWTFSCWSEASYFEFAE